MAAVSARAICNAARAAGYAPLACDLFGDLDLRATAAATVRIDGNLRTGLQWVPLCAALEALADGRSPVGLVCGTGFEDRPALLDRLAERWPLLGNAAEAVRRVKDPDKLARTCERLGIPHPKWTRRRGHEADWVGKRQGGSGGVHVGTVHNGEDARYWQERVAGEPVSALVLAAGDSAIVLGFSTQWPDPLPDAPFRYGGAVRPAPLAPALEAALAEAARAVAEANRLVGLNSVDFLVGKDWHLIEVNPRPGATLDIFDDGRLFELHVAACRGRLPARKPALTGAAATAVVYARREVASVPDFDWPDWTADRQLPGTSVGAGAPLCTVLARADGAAEARRLVDERAAMVRAALGAD